jgi:capsular exopolysaccharide synthesis family protein
MEGASVMEISLNGKVADRDVDFMNILNQEFFDENLRRKNLNAERAIQFISDQLLIIKDSINSSEYKLNAYQMQSGLYSQDKSMRTNTELDGLDKTRAELRLRKEYTNFLIGYLKKENELLVAPSAMGIQDPALSALVAKYNDISYSLKGLGPESPIYKRYKTQLEDTKANLNEAIDAMNSSIRIEENNLSQRYSKLMGEVASLPEKERKLLTHERDFKINDSYNTYLLQRRIESQIQLASNTPDNLVLDKPRTIAVINIADKSNTYLLFTVIGLLLAFVFVFCKEFLFKFSIQSRDEIERISQLPILGTVERSTKKVPVVVKMFPRSSFAENFRSLRSRMEYIARREAPILMLITSTEPQDGKTFIVCNLASTYQLTGKKTLVVDFDLRRPALSKMMGFSKEKGISNYLIGQSKLEDIIIRHPEYDFDVLPAGTVPPNPSELIHSEKTKELLQKLNKEYDYILLDCSPVGLVSDAHFLAKQSDVVLYVVRNEKTNRNFFKYTIAELKEDLLETNIAIIYNDVNLKGNYYGGRKYYGRSPYYSKHDSYYHNEEEQSKEKEGQ